MSANSASSTAHARWDRLHADYERDRIQYDLWLQDFDNILQAYRMPIVDLGCGSGSDAKYLIERGKTVIACDYSARAIESIRKNFPEVQDALCFDMSEGQTERIGRNRQLWVAMARPHPLGGCV